ncbi:MAG TPA: hypothetical protein VK116_11800, partial [Planctomycetota bacterium]|nr:hypothetical protein [Planctomycetota bacterium]
FQNLTLLLLWAALGGLLAGALIVDDAELLIVYDLLALIAAAFWAHHACRTMQIRRHLLDTVEPEFFGSSTVGWEDWLSRHPIEGLLGSRWFIATKGFILGSQVVAAAAAFHVAGRAEIPFAVVASVLFVASIWVLWKPALVSDRTTAASESAAQPSPSAQAGAAR